MRVSINTRRLPGLLALGLTLLVAGCQTTTPMRSDVADSTGPATTPTMGADAGDGPPQSAGPGGVVGEAVDANAPARGEIHNVATPEFALPAGLPEATADANTMVAHFIDVGQGDAILLEFSCAAMLIDTGGEDTARVSGKDRLQTYLEEFFERRSDLARTLQSVVLSHPHADHTGGVSVLLEAEPAIVIMNVLDGGPPGSHASGGKGQRDLEAYAADTEGVGYMGIAESDIKTVSGATNAVIDPINCRRGGVGVDPRISALWGRADLDVAWANNANNDSVVLRVAFGKSVFLFTGDIQAEGIAAMLESYSLDLRAFNADVLKVAHHGSHNATTAGLVAAVTPKIAVIQSGDSSPDDERFSAYAFGHPNATALTNLLDPGNGITLARDQPKQVRVGTKGRHPTNGTPPDFTYWTMDKAIYANGWDGNIAIKATSDGVLTVETEY